MRSERVLVFIEAATVTGPAKNLLDFCRTPDLPVKIHLATFSRGSGDNEFTQAVSKAGIGLTIIPERGSLDLNVTKAMRQLIEDFKPAILQTHAVKSHFLLSVSGLRRRAKWVAFHHGYTTTDLKMLAYNQLDRWSLRQPDRLVTVSRAFERQLIERGVHPSRISILQNAVDQGWVDRVHNSDRAALRQRMGLRDGEKAIVAIGRMSLEKAHCDLIAAFKLVRNARLIDARLILVGDGPERQNLEKMAGEGVIFTGQISDVAPFYAIADVMALASLTEGSPNVLLEAMACGVPSVATTVGGVPEIVTDGESALLVPPRDPARMAEALNRLLTDEQLRLTIKANALDLIRRKHSVRARAQALCEVYASL